jgi:hypothetical protein
MTALSQKVASSKHELTSQEIGNALFGLQGMRANVWETRVLVLQMAVKIQLSHSLIDPQGISNSLYGIQRMTSDCEDVRMLVQALAAKIELRYIITHYLYLCLTAMIYWLGLRAYIGYIKIRNPLLCCNSVKLSIIFIIIIKLEIVECSAFGQLYIRTPRPIKCGIRGIYI